ncbi:hypothetical protein FH508_0001555 [Lysinibacillus sp. CD3-6]|uniref:hypothetical protein n=1 Tax=Lysinibacillus sp. CD3-6 TaxID=2892541 RepID=UPI00116A17E5|nr:hypothetical protein [Lysinibacillus sp. CD3-6]UED80608.1 hypothetical protein FH508_0001555 [Lysinibacillus sp. CD3-6]
MKNAKIIMSILFIVILGILAILLTSGPPKPIVTVEGTKITLVQGSYCWKRIAGTGCVDKISPPELLENKKITPLPVSPNSEIKIKFTKPPIDELEVAYLLNNSESPLVTVEDDAFTAPKEEGIYIYSVSGRWAKGNSSFIFSIRVK